jgi:hypothetical protein
LDMLKRVAGDKGRNFDEFVEGLKHKNQWHVSGLAVVGVGVGGGGWGWHAGCGRVHDSFDAQYSGRRITRWQAH